jgi:deoxycytidylate deaminase
MNYDEAISMAAKIAELGEYPHRVGAVILDKKGRLVSFGFNKEKSHPVQADYACRVGERHRIYLHAEMMAIIKAKGKGHSIFIARLSKNGKTTKLAKPCPICSLAIKEAGISIIHYTEG